MFYGRNYKITSLLKKFTRTIYHDLSDIPRIPNSEYNETTKIPETDYLFKKFNDIYADVKENRIEPQQIKTQAHHWVTKFY